MSFPKYPEYKDSGVQWLGKVPSHWSTRPLWTLFRRIKRSGFMNETLLSVYRDYGVIPKSSRADNFNKPSEDLAPYQLVEVGDLAINKMKAWQGSVAISNYRGIVSPAYFVYANENEEDARYLHYLFRCNEYTHGYLSRSKGIRVNQWDLEPQEHSRMEVLLPPRAEQMQIATFLNHETGQIDALIEEQRRLIELLKEKRQAVISHAVTKGLDPNVPMKDSGVEWLGEVPAHWDILPLMRLTPDERKIMYGIVLPGPHVEGGVPIVKGGDVKPHKLTLGKLSRTTAEIESRYVRSRLKAEDIVYSIRGGVGDVELVPAEIEGANLTQDAARISPLPWVARRWLLFVLKSSSVFAQLDAGALGATIRGINIRDLKRAKIPVAPPEEQRLISNFLDQAVSATDGLIWDAENLTALLAERRSALISATVTGKIDVRGWSVATGAEEPELAMVAEEPAGYSAQGGAE